ncbi:hypothetical protein AVEN_261294-1 [Araneus ventricosus]|uniref:Uncharacterized protein n=1 Tax=Araneus ventricosus TaxID=182803 RepID=A0A4Y2UJH7_ARAVE|nr:hypothetical protein AVEN_261294-1 [Araneus ventricosus]
MTSSINRSYIDRRQISRWSRYTILSSSNPSMLSDILQSFREANIQLARLKLSRFQWINALLNAAWCPKRFTSSAADKTQRRLLQNSIHNHPSALLIWSLRRIRDVMESSQCIQAYPLLIEISEGFSSPCLLRQVRGPGRAAVNHLIPIKNIFNPRLIAEEATPCL